MEDNFETTEINNNNNNNNNDNNNNTKNNISNNKNENGGKEEITLNKISVIMNEDDKNNDNNKNNVINKNNDNNKNNVINKNNDNNKINDNNKNKVFVNTPLEIQIDLEEEKEENEKEEGDDDGLIKKQEKGDSGEDETEKKYNKETVEKEPIKSKNKITIQKKTKYSKNGHKNIKNAMQNKEYLTDKLEKDKIKRKPKINVKKEVKRRANRDRKVNNGFSLSSSFSSESVEDLEKECGEDSLSKSLKLLELTIRQCRKDLGKMKERKKGGVEMKTDKEEESCTQKNLSAQPPSLLSSQLFPSNFELSQSTFPNVLSLPSDPKTELKPNCLLSTLNTIQNSYPIIFPPNQFSLNNKLLTNLDQKPATTNQPPDTNNLSLTSINQPLTKTNQPPTTTDQPPTSTNQPPTTTNQLPTTTDQPPTTTTNQSPTTESLPIGSFSKCHSQKSMFGPQNSQFHTLSTSALKTEKVTVFIRVVFLKIGEIDTMKENFVADAFIQARWHEPLLDGKNDIDRNTIDWRTFWNPKVYIENCFNEPKETVWQTLSFNSRGVATVYEKRRIRACFIENLELDDFPFDTQDLTLTVTTERSEHEVELEEDTDEISSINVQSFVDEQEWKLHSHVETWKKITTKTYQISKAKHPAFATSCRATRRPGFFIWNIFLVMLFICSLTFSTFCVDLMKLENRLQLSFILLLTTVTFKFVVSQTLPRISYLTLLDKYILISMAILCTVCVWHVVVFSAFKNDLERARILDWWALIVSASGYTLFHLIFFFSIYLGALRKGWKYDKKDKEHKDRIKRLQRLQELAKINFGSTENKIRLRDNREIKFSEILKME